MSENIAAPTELLSAEMKRCATVKAISVMAGSVLGAAIGLLLLFFVPYGGALLAWVVAISLLWAKAFLSKQFPSLQKLDWKSFCLLFGTSILSIPGVHYIAPETKDPLFIQNFLYTLGAYGVSILGVGIAEVARVAFGNLYKIFLPSCGEDASAGESATTVKEA